MGEEPDYEALWKRIVAHAERAIEHEKWQARWSEGARFLSDEAYVIERRNSKSHIRNTIQGYDLAAAICQDDLAGYIERWYPQAKPNGPRVSFVTRDEAERAFRVIRDAVADSYDPATIRWGHWDKSGEHGEFEAGEASGYYIATWDAGVRRVGRGPRLWQRAYDLLRRGRELRRKWQHKRR
jgi:hypothetical protein